MGACRGFYGGLLHLYGFYLCGMQSNIGVAFGQQSGR